MKGRIVDLSPSTAQKIGITQENGVARVKVTPISVPLPDGSTKPGIDRPDSNPLVNRPAAFRCSNPCSTRRKSDHFRARLACLGQ